MCVCVRVRTHAYTQLRHTLLTLMYTDWTEEDKVHLGEELSDVLIYLVRLADRCHVDLPAAAIRKFQLNDEKYPTTPGHDRESNGSDYKNTSSTVEEATLRRSCDHRDKG